MTTTTEEKRYIKKGAKLETVQKYEQFLRDLFVEVGINPNLHVTEWIKSQPVANHATTVMVKPILDGKKAPILLAKFVTCSGFSHKCMKLYYDEKDPDLTYKARKLAEAVSAYSLASKRRREQRIKAHAKSEHKANNGDLGIKISTTKDTDEDIIEKSTKLVEDYRETEDANLARELAEKEAKEKKPVIEDKELDQVFSGVIKEEEEEVDNFIKDMLEIMSSNQKDLNVSMKAIGEIAEGVTTLLKLAKANSAIKRPSYKPAKPIEVSDTKTYYLFGFIPVWKRKQSGMIFKQQ